MSPRSSSGCPFLASQPSFVSSSECPHSKSLNTNTTTTTSHSFKPLYASLNCPNSTQPWLKSVDLSGYQVKPNSEGDYDAVRVAIEKIIPNEDYDDGSLGPVLLRLAWHASGTYDAQSQTGGSNGATMRYPLEAQDEANKGLEFARKFLEPIKFQFPWITYADLWTFAGVVALEYCGGPKTVWKPGRQDYDNALNVPPNGRLPDGALGAQHFRDIFYRMGFNDQEIVALCGAHNMGRCHPDRSGWDGPWVPNPTQFSNTYFKLLLNEDWHVKKLDNGLYQFMNEDEEIMMLPIELTLLEDKSFRPWVEAYGNDKQLFFKDFSAAFAKLLELGVRRDKNGIAMVNYVNKAKV